MKNLMNHRVRLARTQTHLPLLYALLFDRGCYKRLSLDDIEPAGRDGWKLLTFPLKRKKKKNHFYSGQLFFFYIYIYIMKSRARRS